MADQKPKDNNSRHAAGHEGWPPLLRMCPASAPAVPILRQQVAAERDGPLLRLSACRSALAPQLAPHVHGIRAAGMACQSSTAVQA